MLNAMYVHNSTRKNVFIILLYGMWEGKLKNVQKEKTPQHWLFENSIALIIWSGIYTGDTENSKIGTGDCLN